MKTISKAPKPFFLYDVVHADGQVVSHAMPLKDARRYVKTWNEVCSQPRQQVHVCKAWRVVPLDGKAVK